MKTVPKNSISLIRKSHMPKVAASRWRAMSDHGSRSGLGNATPAEALIALSLMVRAADGSA